MKPYQKLQRFWAELETGVVSAERGEAEVAALEGRYGICLFEDFREYLLRCCPAESCGMDLSSTDWWGFSDISRVSEENGWSSADRFLFFADFLIWAPAWAIACGDDENSGRVVAVYGAEHHFVADSFAEFVERYVSEPVDLAWLPNPS